MCRECANSSVLNSRHFMKFRYKNSLLNITKFVLQVKACFRFLPDQKNKKRTNVHRCSVSRFVFCCLFASKDICRFQIRLKFLILKRGQKVQTHGGRSSAVGKDFWQARRNPQVPLHGFRQIERVCNTLRKRCACILTCNKLHCISFGPF